MRFPLHCYFVASSHNTYLERDQLRGPSSASAYLSAVQRGCRCVELDCWDGPGGEPSIFHGHTLTQRVPFADVTKALAQYAFAGDSPFPLVLSLEVHCSARQQARMAHHLRAAFGARLLLPAEAEEVKADAEAEAEAAAGTLTFVAVNSAIGLWAMTRTHPHAPRAPRAPRGSAPAWT